MKYEIDTCDWPLIVNEDTKEGAIVALVPLPEPAISTRDAAMERVAALVGQANAYVDAQELMEQAAVMIRRLYDGEGIHDKSLETLLDKLEAASARTRP